MPHPAPARLALLGLFGMVMLSSLPLETLPGHPRLLLSWWERVGTAAATSSILRALAVAGFGYVTTVATLVGVAEVTRCHRLGAGGLRLAPAALRRRLGVGTLALSLAVPGAATAEETPIVLTDVGSDAVPAVGDLTGATSTGPIEAGMVPPPHHPLHLAGGVAGGPDSGARTWRVEPGDHLWAIARHVVTATSPGAGNTDVGAYWIRLIEANLGVVGENPDLIHPGQVIVLPPLG